MCFVYIESERGSLEPFSAVRITKTELDGMPRCLWCTAVRNTVNQLSLYNKLKYTVSVSCPQSETITLDHHQEIKSNKPYHSFSYAKVLYGVVYSRRTRNVYFAYCFQSFENCNYDINISSIRYFPSQHTHYNKLFAMASSLHESRYDYGDILYCIPLR